MTSRFSVGATVYAKDGKSYVVEAIDNGTVYCASENGSEMEFPAEALSNEAEWAARIDGRRDVSYTRLKQSRHFAGTNDNIDPELATQLLTKADRSVVGLLDFVAYTTAARILTENKDHDLVPALSIIKSRQVFDAAKPAVRVGLMATLLSANAETLTKAAKLGDNLLRALIDKGLEPLAQEFEDFCDRPRK